MEGEGTNTPRANCAAEQILFDHFRTERNESSALVAWVAQNYETATPVVIVAAVIAAVVLAVTIVLINRRAFRRIEALEDV